MRLYYGMRDFFAQHGSARDLTTLQRLDNYSHRSWDLRQVQGYYLNSVFDQVGVSHRTPPVRESTELHLSRSLHATKQTALGRSHLDPRFGSELKLRRRVEFFASETLSGL